MATLELAKNIWWNQFTREEQEQYLKEHPRSKLKINKRRKKGYRNTQQQEENKDDVPSVGEEHEVDKVAKDTFDTPADDVDKVKEAEEETKEVEQEEQLSPAQEDMLEENDKAVQGGSVESLNKEEQVQAAEELSKKADQYEPTAVMDKLTDDDKKELEDDLQDAIDEEDDDEKEHKFAKTALKLGLKIGLITAGVLLVGSVSPMVLFLPQVHGSIWSRATDWSDTGSSMLFKGVDSIHNTMKKAKNLAKHITHGVKEKSGGV